MSPEELRRQQRVLDQMVTAYSVLRDRYRRRSRWLNIGLLGCSVALCACAFMSDSLLLRYGVSSQECRLVIGLLSVAVFFLSLVEFRVDWKSRAAAFGDAAEKVATLKLRIRGLIDEGGDGDPQHVSAVAAEYAVAMEALPRIPDDQFLSLKAVHARKIVLSKMVDEHPGAPVFALRAMLFLKATLALCRKDKGDAS